MKIAMANDHAGTNMKNEIKALLESMGHEVVDFGTYDNNPADLPDYVYPAALAVAKGECDRGIFVDGVAFRIMCIRQLWLLLRASATAASLSTA